MTPAYEGALKAARAGMFVFPCDPGDKRPVSTPHGRLRWGQHATTDEAVIRDWFETKCRTANYGIAAKHSRLLVVDCDMPKQGKVIPRRFAMGGIEIGEDMWAQAVYELDVPFPMDTLVVETPSGGAHYYFRNTANVQLRNTSLIPSWLDIRANGGADGGYVLGPGSRSSDGGDYTVRWRNPIREAPDWLIQICTEPPKKPAPPPMPRAPGQRSFDGPAKFDGLVDTLRAKTSDRNNCLHWCACAMAIDGASLDEAIRTLRPAAEDCGLDDWEIEPTIRSAYRSKGM